MHRRMFLKTVALGAPALALTGCVAEEGAYYGPAYGSTAFDYDYYPAANVYYYPAGQVWYYPQGGRWLRATRLPAFYRIRESDRRRIYHPSNHPYERNQDHRRGRFDDRPRDGRDGSDGRDRRRENTRVERRDTRDDRRETQASAEVRARAEQEARRTERQTRRDERQETRRAARETEPEPVTVPGAYDYRSGPPSEQHGIR